MNTRLRLVEPCNENRSVAPGRASNASLRPREYLTPAEVEKLIKAAKDGRYGHRDAAMILVAFRHGLRATEVCEFRWERVDFNGAVLHVAVRVRQRAWLPVYDGRLGPDDRARRCRGRP